MSDEEIKYKERYEMQDINSIEYRVKKKKYKNTKSLTPTLILPSQRGRRYEVQNTYKSKLGDNGFPPSWE